MATTRGGILLRFRGAKQEFLDFLIIILVGDVGEVEFDVLPLLLPLHDHLCCLDLQCLDGAVMVCMVQMQGFSWPLRGVRGQARGRGE